MRPVFVSFFITALWISTAIGDDGAAKHERLQSILPILGAISEVAVRNDRAGSPDPGSIEKLNALVPDSLTDAQLLLLARLSKVVVLPESAENAGYYWVFRQVHDRCAAILAGRSNKEAVEALADLARFGPPQSGDCLHLLTLSNEQEPLSR